MKLKFLKIRLASAEITMSKVTPCCRVLLWTSFCFLQVNQQKRVGLASTNITNSDIQTFLIETIPHSLRLADPNTEQLIHQTEKSNHLKFSINMLFLKILSYSQENTSVKFLRAPTLNHICVLLLLI